MAEEPNKRMDELLKAYADKRRQDSGAPVELHPATRQLLQGEVARLYRRPRAQSWFSRLLVYWPRVAFAAACMAITFALMLVVLPRRVAEHNAQTELAAVSRDLRAAEELADKVQDKEKSAALNEFANAPPPAPSAARAMPQSDDKRLDAFAKKNEREALQVAKPADLARRENKEADELKLMFEQPAKDEQVRVQTGNRRYMQRGQEVYLGAKVETPKQILTSFQYEQKGENITITDQDGSVYAGRTLSEEELRKHSDSSVTVVGGVAGSAANAAYSVQFFRAAGTNRSLRQLVSIEANIMQTNLLQTNALPALPALNAPVNLNGRAPAQQPQSQLQPLIRGRVTIGKTQELKLDAVPAQQQQP